MQFSDQKKPSLPLLSLRGSSQHLIKDSSNTDRILPGQASRSLLEQLSARQPLVNEVRVSDRRANKAQSFVNSGLLSDPVRTFNLQDAEKKGLINFRKHDGRKD